MKLIFYSDLIKGNEILFWAYIAIMILIIVLTCIFVKKEVKNESK